jgi:hypothetical protein
MPAEAAIFKTAHLFGIIPLTHELLSAYTIS